MPLVLALNLESRKTCNFAEPSSLCFYVLEFRLANLATLICRIRGTRTVHLTSSAVVGDIVGDTVVSWFPIAAAKSTRTVQDRLKRRSDLLTTKIARSIFCDLSSESQFSVWRERVGWKKGGRLYSAGRGGAP
jgi:hypothetical protein